MNIKEDAKKVAKLLWYNQHNFGPDLPSAVFTAGNGGSASIAAHMACDWMKGCSHKFMYPLRVTCLSSNTSLLTALANDCGYEESIAAQIRWLCFGDIVVLISSSGKSPNIVKAAQAALEQGCTLVGFTGFDGGALKQLAQINVHLDSKDYGEIEDYHSQVMHEVMRQLLLDSRPE